MEGEAAMAMSFYDLCVPSYRQMLTGVAGFLERGLDHCRETNVDPNEMVEARLYADMLPFRFQIWSVKHHSLGALEGIGKGVFTPPPDMPALDYAGLQGVVAETQAALGALNADDVNALAGRDVVFQFRDFKMPFTAEGFIQSFSFPNFYFHATTAYDILRSRGVPLGKRDFMGPPRLKS
jgi:hypothetical protein